MLDGRCGILKLTIQISLTPKKFKSGGKKKERKKKKSALFGSNFSAP